MASIRKEIVTSARPQSVWDAIRDVGALHTRLVPGFVVDTRLEPGARIVTFANGMVAREPIVTVDDEARRLVWGAERKRSPTTTPPSRPSARAAAPASSGSPTSSPTRPPAPSAP